MRNSGSVTARPPASPRFVRARMPNVAAVTPRSARAAEPGSLELAGAGVRPALMTVPDVELLTVGTFNASTGLHTFTQDDILSAVAAVEDPAVRKPVIKIGHTDFRFNAREVAEMFVTESVRRGVPQEVAMDVVASLLLGDDGTPAIGRVDNMRYTDDRMSVRGDYVGMPAWLAQVLVYAYPSRSIEGWWGVTTSTGRYHRFILTGVALLGDSLPAVQVLEDVRDIYYPADDS